MLLFAWKASRVISTAGFAVCSVGSEDLVSVVLWWIIPEGHLRNLGLWERSAWSFHQLLCTDLKHRDLKRKAFCFTLSSCTVPGDWKENFL